MRQVNIMMWVPLLFVTIVLVKASPLPFHQSESSVNLNNNNTGRNQMVIQGSDEYNALVQERRNVTGGDGANGSLVINGTFFLGVNGTDNCLGQPTCVDSIRDKQLRLMSIRNYVLNTLGYGKAPSPQSIRRNSNNRPKAPETNFSGKIQTFYASCQVPTNVDKDVWSTPEYFHLYFNFAENFNDTPAQQNESLPVESNESGSLEGPSTRKTTVSAKLRLFKIGPITTQPEAVDIPATVNISDQINETSFGFTGEALPLVEEKIRVSVYWYKAPITKHHYKKKLLDTKMLSVKDSKWVDFDIMNAAVHWLDKQEKNFGLVVQVENEDNDLVDPSKYFVNIPCKENSTEPIINPPTIEICTLNTPQSSREVDTSSSFFPFPMGQSFGYLNRVAKSHANANRINDNSGSPTEWQNDDIRDDQQVLITPRHHNKHRHGHGNKGKKPENSFKLDEDHPLRRILATVASNVNSRGRTRTNSHNQNHQNHHQHHQLSAAFEDKLATSTEGDDSGERDIIIQKIYITSPNNQADNESDSLNR